MARKLKTIFLAGPAGRLEALLEEPPAAERIERAAIVCHPHPQHGGTMHNKVVYRMARAARSEGAAVLRFNYRGVGMSAGTYDAGAGEQDDLRVAMRYMQDRFPGKALAVGGFSFGSRVALRVCCGDPGVERVIAVGTPVYRGDWSFLGRCGCPKRFVHSTNDQYGSRASLERVYAAAADPKMLAWVEASDHFFAGGLEAFETEMRAQWR